MQRLRRFQCTYTNMLSVYVLPHVETLNKVVEVRMDNFYAKRPYKYTTLLKEIMGLKVFHGDEEVPAVQSCIPVAHGMGAGTVKVTVKSEVPEAIALVEKIRKCVTGGFWGYWTQVRGYKKTCCQTLMESFEIEAATLAGYSTFCVKDWTVTTDFPDEGIGR